MPSFRPEGSLTHFLVKQCVANFQLSSAAKTGPSASGGSPHLPSHVLESLHPYFHTCDYRGEVQCDGAKALRITFDPGW